MDIAVFMSTYNGEAFIEKQLDSIKKQTLADHIHLYVRDDGSNDRTVKLLEEFKTEIDMTIICGDNIGPEKSFWELFTDERIKADYYAFCDQDDIWDEDKLEKGIMALSGRDDKELWCSNCRVIDGKDVVIAERYHVELPCFTISSQFVCGSIQGCAMFFSNRLRDMIISENISVFPMHDFVLVTYAIVNDWLIYDDMPRFSYRIHDDNVIAKGNRATFSGIRSSIVRWFGAKYKHVLSRYAGEFYKANKDKMAVNEGTFINDLANSRKSLNKRLRVVKSPLCVTRNAKGLRSFKIRTMIGII